MVVGWGEMGALWNHHPVVSVFIHPSRHTSEFIRAYDTFAVSFYDKSHKRALVYLGSHSGRDGDKVAAAGLTPVALGDGVTFKEAEPTFLCKRIYINEFSKEGLAPEVRFPQRHLPRRFFLGKPPRLSVNRENCGGFPRNLCTGCRSIGTIKGLFPGVTAPIGRRGAEGRVRVVYTSRA